MNKLIASWVAEFGVDVLIGYSLITSIAVLCLLGNIRSKVRRRITLSDVVVQQLFRLSACVRAFCEAVESFLTAYREVKREELDKFSLRAFSLRFEPVSNTEELPFDQPVQRIR